METHTIRSSKASLVLLPINGPVSLKMSRVSSPHSVPFSFFPDDLLLRLSLDASAFCNCVQHLREILCD